MHQQAHLFLLQLQAPLQALLLKVESQRLGEAERHRLQALAQRIGPDAAVGLHLESPQQQLLVPQR